MYKIDFFLIFRGEGGVRLDYNFICDIGETPLSDFYQKKGKKKFLKKIDSYILEICSKSIFFKYVQNRFF